MSEANTVLSDEQVEDILSRLRVVYAKWHEPQFTKRILDEDVPALCATVKALRAERLEIQRAVASSVLHDPTEDDNPPYSTREIVGGITGLIDRKASLLTQCVALKARLSEVERERDRFAALADQRHDQLWEARRQRDDLAARCAPYLENLK